jgi:hypothetical protein
MKLSEYYNQYDDILDNSESQQQPYTFNNYEELKKASQSAGGLNREAREQAEAAPFQYAEAREPDAIDTAIIIGAEVVPAILGGIGFGLVGGATGSALGNYLSQQYRIGKGFQKDFGAGEFTAATIAGGIPLGNVTKFGTAGAVAARGVQGAAIAGSELAARTYYDEGRAPTQEEIATTLLFGGVFGGGLGAVEAKFLSDGTGVDLKPGMTRPEVKDALASNIKDKGGVENASVGNPLVKEILETNERTSKARQEYYDTPDPFAGSADDVAGEVLQGIENKLLKEADDTVQQLASTQLGEEATGVMAGIQKSLDGEIAQQDEIFGGLNNEINIGVQRLGDSQKLREIDESIARLDHKLGKGKGAKKQRAKLAAEKRMVLKRNNMEGALDLQSAMRGNQGGADQPTKAMNFTDRPMKEAGPASKAERMAEEKLGSNYEKFIKNVKQGMTREFALGAGATGAVTLGLLSDDEENEISRAGFSPMLLALLFAGGMGARQFNKFKKTAAFKRTNAQAKANPSKVEPIFAKEARVAQEADRIYNLPSRTSRMIKDVKDILGDVLTPISRQAKNIGPFVAKAFRDVDLKGLKRKAQFKKAAQPFILSVNKLLKNDKVALEKFNDDLNTQNFDGIREMLDKKNVMHKLGKEFQDTIDTLGAIRAYGREEGGIDVGFLENYFPRQVMDYPSLRKFLDEDPTAREATTSIDQAFAKYADEHEMSVENLTNQERAEITSRVLAGRVQSNAPGNTKARSINDVELYQKIKGAYAKPLDALDNYIDSIVDAVEKRKFLGQVKSKSAPNVGMEGSSDTNPLADLGMRADISDTLADKVAKDMLKGQEYSEQDIQKLRSLIQSRFGGVPVSPAIQGLKNANYIQVMTNFGSAVTQFGDLGFSAHFNGMDNTFKSLFNRKDVYDFTDSIGLSGKDYDTTSGSAFLGKTLDTLFTATGLKKIDQLGKNTFMNAAWRKYHKLAKKDTKALADELTPYFGKQRADEISIAVRDNAPNSKSVPLEVEELVFHKLLDVAPATASEMPALYTRMGKGRIFYMLKSFTIKQLDTYREAGASEIYKGISKYNSATTSSERLAGAKQAGKGLAKLTQLAAIFAAANASTDVIKDTLAGRPTKKDELLENNIWKLFGLNRYTYYNAKRQGVGKATAELMLPPTAIFDRMWTDVSSIYSGDEYKGAMLQGTPLDLIYWRYLGGLDKINNSK